MFQEFELGTQSRVSKDESAESVTGSRIREETVQKLGGEEVCGRKLLRKKSSRVMSSVYAY